MAKVKIIQNKLLRGLVSEIATAIKKNKTWELYERWEDNNYHTELVLLYAYTVGSAADIKKAIDMWLEHQKSTEGVSSDFIKERYEFSQPLWKKFLENAKAKEKRKMAEGGLVNDYYTSELKGSISNIESYLNIQDNIDDVTATTKVSWDLDIDARSWGIKSIDISVPKVVCSVEWFAENGDYSYLSNNAIDVLTAAGYKNSNGDFEGIIEIDSAEKINGKEWTIEVEKGDYSWDSLMPREVEVDFKEMKIKVSFESYQNEYENGGSVGNVENNKMETKNQYYEITQFSWSSYAYYILDAESAIAKFGKGNFEKSIGADAWKRSIISHPVVITGTKDFEIRKFTRDVWMDVELACDKFITEWRAAHTKDYYPLYSIRKDVREDRGTKYCVAIVTQPTYINKLENGGSVGTPNEDISRVVSAIFSSNEKNGKVETEAGNKTEEGLFNLIADSDATYSASAIFNSNERDGKITTDFGVKTFGGLQAMIAHAKNGRLSSIASVAFKDGGLVRKKIMFGFF